MLGAWHHRPLGRSAGLVLATCLALVAATGRADGQYFGQNKVRYSNFEFKVLKTEHFDIYYYDREQRTIDEAARLAERWYARLSEVFEHQLSRRQPLILYANQADFQQTTVIPGIIGEGTGGVTEAIRNRVVLPFTASLAETSHVLGHELVHAFQFDMAGQNALRLPLWFIEGMAEYVSLGPVHAQTALWLRDAAIRDELPAFDKLDNPRLFPYRFGHAAWAYLAGRWGDDLIRRLYLAAAQTGDPVAALEALTQTRVDAISAAWHESVYRTYGELAKAKATPRGRALITEDGDGGELNVGPALSPSGDRLIFFSERELFSIEMFLADARTGKVIRKLTEFATDPHFDSIEFLQSTGGWSFDGRRFLYTTTKAAKPVLVIVDADTGDRLRSIELRTLGGAINPTWSPDGRFVAFSGLIGGASDLFLYDLQTDRLDQVTRDLFAQIQPRWSPDGRSIAFVTDQFTTRLDTLAFGNYRLALYDVSARTVRPLPGFDGAKNINPQWAPDGRTIYFLADPNGISNVFRLRLADESIAPVTSVVTGVTGITDTSPALDVAARTGRLAYTVFTDRKYEIYTLDADQLDAEVALARVNAAVLPPRRDEPSEVAAALRAPRTGLLPPGTKFPVTGYDPSLALDYVGAVASTGFATNSVGAVAGGGLALVFSDLLNFHQLTTVVDANTRSARDVGGQVTYLNRSTRWNLGASAQWVPFVTGAFSQELAQVDGQPVVLQRERLFRQINRQVLGLTQYPLNRAARFEFAGGLRSIAFDQEVTTRVFSPTTGQLLGERTTDLTAPATLNLAQTTGAFVYDTSVFGVASPVLGTRARFEVTPTFGTLRFTEVVADARRYVVLRRPLTLAGRLLHFGRYGSDGENEVLTPLYLGYPSLVRGYEIDSFTGGECRADATSSCPAFDRLVGSRLLVGNAELRFPLVGLFTGEFTYGPLPVEGFVFGDAGVAWTSRSRPSFLDGDRRLVTSAGAGVRLNLLGFAALEFAGVRPFDRPDDSWRFVFNIVPGF